MRLLAILFSFFWLSLQAQTECANMRDVVPKGRQFYMIGEAHMGGEIPIRENVRMIAKTTIAEDSLRTYLSGTCGVNNYMLELPNCYSYFVREYMNSGDTSWIGGLSTDAYWYMRIKHLYALKTIRPDLRVNCVDVNYPQYTERTLFALVTLSFYDHYWAVYYPPYNNITAKPVSADLNVALAILQTDTINITAPLRELFYTYIRLLVSNPIDQQATYDLFKKTMQNKSLMLAMEKYYNTGWPEVQLIMQSYLTGYQFPDITNDMIAARDTMLFSYVKELVDHSPGDIFCLQLGDMHTRGRSEQGDVRDLLYKEYGFRAATIHLVPETFAYRLQKVYKRESPYNFNFTSPWCIQEIKPGEVEMLVKN